jgi:cytidine diphosphoramidate kinase
MGKWSTTHIKMIIWIIGKSAAGKTVIGQELNKLIKNEHKNVVALDGDIFRGLHDNDLDYSIESRKKNSDRISRMCQFLDQQDIHVVCSTQSNFHDAQQWNRDNYNDYFEIYLDVPYNILLQRDPKGLYKKALAGEMPNMVGLDIKFTPPLNPHMTINNVGDETPLVIAQRIFAKITHKFKES